MSPISSIKLNMTDWQAVVFDLDDTLYPEQSFVLSGYRAVAVWAEQHLGIATGQVFAELKALFDAGMRQDVFNYWLAARGLPDDGLVVELIKVYRQHSPIIAPFPSVPALLCQLRDRFRVGLVSDGYLRVQQQKLTAL